MKEIKFGTSGWRAIIADEFTFKNVRIVVQAIADYVKQTNKKQEVVVGYDTRFLSKEFADEAANVLSANGIKALLCDRDVPTPVIAYHIIRRGCAGGINFTASHNPPQYNGIKFSPHTGGPATPEITRQIEENIARIQQDAREILPLAVKENISIFDPKPAYIKDIKKKVDIGAIKRSHLKIALDCLYGTSRGYLDRLLQEYGIQPQVLHDYLNPNFNGHRPEPAPENIQELITLVRRKRLHLGLATDGDADRFGIIDSDGTYINPNQVITLLFYHLLTTRKKPGSVVARTVATTHMIDAIASKYNIKVIETPVGFKYFVDIISKGDCVIAGEESGGLSVIGHLPEKDGIIACLLIAEMVAVNRKSIRQILNLLYKRYGFFYSHRIDLTLQDPQKTELVQRLKQDSLASFGGLDIISRDTRDGCKLHLKGGAWALFRPSGTEPIVRCYFEANTQAGLNRLVKAGQKMARF